MRAVRLTLPEIEVTIAESGGGNRLGRHALAAGMELRAGEHASESDLAAAEASGQWHLIARALLERVRRAAPIPATSLQRVRTVPVERAVVLAPREDWAEVRGCGFAWTTLSPDLVSYTHLTLPTNREV